VGSKILTVVLALAAGFVARRRRLVDEAGIQQISRLVVDLAMPALVISELSRTVRPHSFAGDLPMVAAGFSVVSVCQATGLLFGRSPTEAFLIGIPNWVFLPLLIAEALHGANGVRAVLLFNVGAQISLWTVGMRVLGGKTNTKELLLNPGLLAAVVGVAIGGLLPGVAAWSEPSARASIAGWVGGAAFDALALLGQVCVPLNLFASGALLFSPAEASTETGKAPRGRPLLRVLAGRLLLAPCLVVLLLRSLQALGVPTEQSGADLIVLVAAMPVAITATLFAKRFGGDARLAAQAVFWSTLFSVFSAPLAIWIAGLI
jgi:hypothetical protein